MESAEYRLIVIGTSAGGLAELVKLLRRLPRDFHVPIAIVQHLSRSVGSHLAELLTSAWPGPVVEIEDKEPLEPATVYVAPPNYHVLVEPAGYFSLSVDPEVNFSRPSVDVLFESAAASFAGNLIGVVLTGANRDGAAGLKEIKRRGGYAMVQDPATTQFRAMPQAALDAVAVDFVGSVEELSAEIAKRCPARRS